MALSPGFRLGPYEILAPLGAGGMGEVYRARDTKLDREVAIKILPQSLAADPASLARFEREAKVVAALSHPNILAIHDLGKSDGVTYAVMELLEGENLRQRLASGALPQRKAIEIARQIALGLAAAHEKGIVHRDLKPENLFLTHDGRVKILDFGLARQITLPSVGETESPTVTQQTEPGTVLGTVGYISPELLRGQPADARSDIFAFGAVLYEMLSGKRAFVGDTAIETMNAILRDEPQDLSESGRNVPLALDHIVRHCLEKSPEQRFHSAHDIVFALEEMATGAVASGLQAASPRAGKKNVFRAAVVGAALLLGIGGILLLRRPHKGTSEAELATRLAVLPFENLGAAEDDYFADGMEDEVRGKLTSLPGLQVIARGSSRTYKKTTKTPRQIGKELNVSYLLTATVRWEKAAGTSRVHVNPELVDVSRPDAPTSKWQQPFDAALTDVFQVQSDIATRVAQALGMALGAGEEKRLGEKPTQNLAAYDAFLKGEEASKSLAAFDPPSLRRALAFYEQAVALDPGFAQAWAHLSRANSSLYWGSVPTPALAERARQASERAVALAPNRPEGYVALGVYERLVLKDPDRSLQQYIEAQRRAPGNAELIAKIASAELYGLGRWEAGVEHFRQAARLDPRSVPTQMALGDASVRLRRYPEAREAFDRGLALAPANLAVIEFKAMSFLAQGDLTEARAVLKAAPREVEPTALVAYVASYYDLVWVLDPEQRELLLRLTPSAFDDDRGVWGFCLAQAYALRGDVANVRSHAEEARKAFEEQLRAAPGDAQRRVLLGLTLAYLGRKAEAIREGERGAALLPVAKDPASGPYIQHQLTRIYMLLNEPEKALDRLEPLLKIPYYLTPGWLKIDPNFDPLRGNPRFQKLVESAK